MAKVTIEINDEETDTTVRFLFDTKVDIEGEQWGPKRLAKVLLGLAAIAHLSSVKEGDTPPDSGANA